MATTYALADTSKTWIYQSDRAFTKEEGIEIEGQINVFCENWVSHSNELKAAGQLVNNRFIVLMVDESNAGASGCSIDKSVHFIKSIGSKYKTDMFDRMNFAYQVDGEIKTADREEFVELYNNNTINDNTLVFDNLVSNKADFENKWIKPLKDSWHSRMV
jgi:hypothetical protein